MTVVMVVGSPDYGNQGRRVPQQMRDVLAHYGRLTVIARNGAGPGHVAMGWAAGEGVPYAAVVTRDRDAATAALIGLAPVVCVAFGDCPEARAAKAAGIPTYEV